VAFEKRNATVHEQNVWCMIFTNATILADNIYFEENLPLSEIAHCYWSK